MTQLSNYVTSALAVLTFIFAVYQWYKSEQRKKSDFLFQYAQTILKDNMKGLYQLDYSEEFLGWYNERFHSQYNFKNQFEIDRILYMFNYICYLKKKRLISNSEFILFEYDILRLWKENEDFKNYMFNLYHYSIECKVKMPFYYLMKIGKKYLPDNFYNKDSKDYPHYLIK